MVFSDDELGYIALHVHSSLESMQVSQAMQTAAIIRECVDLVQQETGVVIDVSSLSYNRLMSHIKYMAARLIKGEKLSMDVNTISASPAPKPSTLPRRSAASWSAAWDGRWTRQRWDTWPCMCSGYFLPNPACADRRRDWPSPV